MTSGQVNQCGLLGNILSGSHTKPYKSTTEQKEYEEI